MKNKTLLCLAGPTASGKSAFAIDLAKKINAEIICVDAVQVYAHANIGSAKVSLEEQQSVVHHCMDLIEPHEQLDAQAFGNKARDIIQQIHARDKNIIVCVGSTMYFQALLYGLVDAIPKNIGLRGELEKLSNEDLHKKLVAVDLQKSIKLHPNDRQRVIRALEVAMHGAEIISNLQEDHGFKKPLYDYVSFCLTWPREELYKRIEQRTEKMIDQGLVEETEKIIKQYSSDAPLLQAIGYREAKEYLEGSIELEAMSEQISQATRNYAKRQLTFWKNEPTKRGLEIFPKQQAKKFGQQDPDFLSLDSSGIINLYNESQGLRRHFFVNLI